MALRILQRLAIVAAAVTSITYASAAPLRIVLVGDSTMCEYDRKLPDRGWGMYLADAFRPGSVKVFNHAKPGRSTKTFINEGLWKKALEDKPDYVFIQFGHNDSHERHLPESTDSETDYREYLVRYINESRAAGATPILVTPMVRRTFKPDGKLDDNLAPYAAAMKAVAAKMNCAIIDLHAASWALVELLGPERARQFARNKNDPTHFNEKGARVMCGLVVSELDKTDPRLAALRIVSPR